jgi:hypothetical protein
VAAALSGLEDEDEDETTNDGMMIDSQDERKTCWQR